MQFYIRDKNLLSCERQAKLEFPTFISSEIAEKAMNIFTKKYNFKTPLRSVGVRGINLVDQHQDIQLNLFTDQVKRDQVKLIEFAKDELRNRYGYSIIKTGALLF